MNVLPKMNLQGYGNSLIFSSINKVDLQFDSTSIIGFSNDFECEVLPAK